MVRWHLCPSRKRENRNAEMFSADGEGVVDGTSLSALGINRALDPPPWLHEGCAGREGGLKKFAIFRILASSRPLRGLKCTPRVPPVAGVSPPGNPYGAGVHVTPVFAAWTPVHNAELPRAGAPVTCTHFVLALGAAWDIGHWLPRPLWFARSQ